MTAPHRDGSCQHLPKYQHKIGLDTTHNRCYPKRLKKRLLITLVELAPLLSAEQVGLSQPLCHKKEEKEMIMFVIGFVAGLVVGWNFLPQPAWLKDMVSKLFKK
jgi:hypothetical protein